MNYQKNKHLNKFSYHNRCKAQYYKQMNMWNGQRANVINQMPTNAQNDDDYYNIQDTQ